MLHFKPKKLKNRFKIGFLLILIGLLIFTISLDRSIRPILLQQACAKAQIYANTILNQSIEALLQEQNVTYADLVKVSRSDDASVHSIEIDTLAANGLKSALVNRAQQDIAQADPVLVSIPYGTLTGIDYLIGRGPKLRFSVDLSASVSAQFKSHFSAAGINQTLHRIVLHLNTKLYLVLPLYRTDCALDCDFLIAETVIVGKIPDAYTNVVETPSDDIAGVLFDYSAQAS